MMGPHRLHKLVCLLALLHTGSPSIAFAQPMKSPLSGFVSMGTVGLGPGEKPNNSLQFILAEPGVFSGVVINISWTQLEPAPNSFDTSGIDQALQAVAAYNAAYPTAPLGVRLNVESGLLAPGWAKNLNGPPIEITDIPNGTSPPIIFTIGRFWEPAYSNDWRQLQNMLAAKYDGNPLIHEVTNGSCATVTDEPFVLVTTPFGPK
jgi:hypothetical protein